MEEKVTYGSYDEFLESTYKGKSDDELNTSRRTIIRLKHTGQYTQTNEVADRRIRQIEDELKRRGAQAEHMNIRAEELHELIRGKTVQTVEVVSTPEQDFDIIFTDGTRLTVRAIGDDMSYTDLGLRGGSTS